MLSVESGASPIRMELVSPVVPRFLFTSKELAPSDQFEGWRETVRPIMELVPRGGKTAGFAAQIEAYDLGRMALLRSKTAPAGFRRTAMQARNSAIDHWCFTAVKQGKFQTNRPGHACVAQPGGTFVKSMHSIMEGELDQVSTICLIVPRDFLRERVASIDAVDETVLTSGLGRLLANYLIDLGRQLPKLSAEELPRILAGTHAMIEACILPTPDHLAAAARPIDATLLERARRLVHQYLTSPHFGTDELCRELRISRSRLYRLFKQEGGVVHFIRTQRLIDAHRILASPTNRRTVTDLAMERHFLDPADFSRAFKKEFGYSPREAKGACTPDHHVPTPLRVLDTTLGDLLLGLQ